MSALDFSEFYADWGFWALLVQWVAVALTALVPPLPAELMVVASGALAADGALSLHWAFIATFTGCIVGDVGLYALFRYKLIRLLHRWKWGRRLHRRIDRIAEHAGGPATWAGLLLVIAMPSGRPRSDWIAVSAVRWRLPRPTS